jgi:hypothetical protein
VLEVDTGVKPARYRAPLRATGLDPRLPLPTEVLHAIDTLMWLNSPSLCWIKGFAGFPVLWQIGELDAVVGQHGVDLVRDGRRQFVEEGPGRRTRGLLHQTGEGIFGGPVHCHEEIEFAFLASAARHARAISGTRLSNGRQQQGAVSDPSASDWRNNAELGEMSSDRIDYYDPLADEQMTGSVKHQAAQLLRRLVGTNRILAQVTASQIASASAMSFFCRLTQA